MAGRKRATKCKRGHPLVDPNLVYRNNGKTRECRTCFNERQRTMPSKKTWRKARNEARAKAKASESGLNPAQPVEVVQSSSENAQDQSVTSGLVLDQCACVGPIPFEMGGLVENGEPVLVGEAVHDCHAGRFSEEDRKMLEAIAAKGHGQVSVDIVVSPSTVEVEEFFVGEKPSAVVSNEVEKEETAPAGPGDWDAEPSEESNAIERAVQNYEAESVEAWEAPLQPPAPVGIAEGDRSAPVLPVDFGLPRPERRPVPVAAPAVQPPKRKIGCPHGFQNPFLCTACRANGGR